MKTLIIAIILTLFSFGEMDSSGAARRSKKSLKAVKKSSLTLKKKRKRKSPTYYDFSLGLPELLNVSVLKPITKKTQFGLSFGFIPGRPFLQSLGPSLSNEVNERYSMEIIPDANVISSGAKLKYSPWLGRSYFEGFFNVLIINVGGRAVLKNNATSDRTSLADVDVTLVQSLVGANYGYRFYQTKSMKVSFHAGVSYRFPIHMKTRTRGTLPAFLDVAPEYRTSVVDGTDKVVNDVSSQIDEIFNNNRLLPNLGIQIEW